MLERTQAPWRAEGAWDAAAIAPGRSGNPDGTAGVILRPLGFVPMATVIARRTEMANFERIVAERWGFGAPPAGRAHSGPEGDLVWSAPNQWLAVGGTAAGLDELGRALAGTAAVTAQGDGRALVEVGGPCARQALAKCLSVDLHPEVFGAGCAAVTAFAHLSVQIWQRERASDLTLCVPRTVAGSVWRSLTMASAAFGCETVSPR